MESILIGVALGLFAGVIPGPFLALVAHTALDRGLRDGLKTALIPLVTEIPVLLLSVFALTRLPRGVLQWIGIGGGVLILYMAWRVEVQARDADPTKTDEDLESLKGHYFRVAAVGLLSPSPWIFWFLIAGPLTLNRWQVSWLHGVSFLLAFFACFVGMMMLVAWGSSVGRERLSNTWYRRALRITGAVLAVAGSVLIWQSIEGNFESMVRPQERIQRAVEEGQKG